MQPAGSPRPSAAPPAPSSSPSAGAAPPTPVDSPRPAGPAPTAHAHAPVVANPAAPTAHAHAPVVANPAAPTAHAHAPVVANRAAPTPPVQAPVAAPQGAPTAEASSGLGVLDALLAPGAPPVAVLVRRPPPVRPREILALIAIVALADLALYQGNGGAGLAVLFTGVPAILFGVATRRVLSRRFAAIAAIVALIAGRCLWQSSAGATALGMAMLLPFAIALRTSHSFVPELVASVLGSAWGSVRQLGAFSGALGRLARPVRSLRASWAALYIPAALV